MRAVHAAPASPGHNPDELYLPHM